MLFARKTDAKGRITLGVRYANQAVSSDSVKQVGSKNIKKMRGFVTSIDTNIRRKKKDA